LLVLAAIFPVVNPPGSALVFLCLTQRASADTRRFLAWRVVLNSFFVMSGSLLLGIVAGGIVVAVAGWKLLNERNEKHPEDTRQNPKTRTIAAGVLSADTPLTTGPGTSAVMISIGFGRSRLASAVEELRYLAMTLLAAICIESRG
jgi:multiple antibiotic resistance protein